MVKKRDGKLRFNVVDGIVLFLVIVCIATVIGRSVTLKDKYAPLGESEFTVSFVASVVSEADRGAIESVSDGDGVYTVITDADGKERKIYLGSVDKAPAYTDGISTLAQGTVTVSGYLMQNGLEFDSDAPRINPDDELTVFTEKATFKIKITSIDWK